MSSLDSESSMPAALEKPDMTTAQASPPARRPRAMSSGTIKTFDSSQGQGLIRPSDGSQDVHFHLRNLQTSIKALFPGQKISFAVSEDAGETVEAKHPIAVEVEMEDGHLEPRFLRLGFDNSESHK